MRCDILIITVALLVLQTMVCFPQDRKALTVVLIAHSRGKGMTTGHVLQVIRAKT